MQVKVLPITPYILCTPTLLGAGDVTISPRVQPRATEPLQPFQITLTVDGVSQEFNETFSIEFPGLDFDDIFLFPSEAPVTISRLEGTIVDQDSKCGSG